MYSINYDAVLSSKHTPAYIKQLVKDIQRNGGITIGHWLKELSTIDLINAVNASEAFIGRRGPDPFTDILFKTSFILLVDVLCSGEGLDPAPSSNSIMDRGSLLDIYLICELLSRKGLDIRIKYDRLSLNDDVKDPSGKEKIIEFGDSVVSAISKKMATLSKDPLPPEDDLKKAISDLFNSISSRFPNETPPEQGSGGSTPPNLH